MKLRSAWLIALLRNDCINAHMPEQTLYQNDHTATLHILISGTDIFSDNYHPDTAFVPDATAARELAALYG